MRIRFGRFELPLPLVEHGGIAQKLQGALGIHGRTAAPQLGDVIHPVVMVEDLSRGETLWSTPAVDRPCAGGDEFDPGAGVYAQIGLSNPAGSATICRVHGIHLTGGGSGVFWIFPIPVGNSLGTPSGANTSFRDFRLLAGKPQAYLTADAMAFAPNENPALAILPVSSSLYANYDADIILPPGSGVAAHYSVLAGIARVSFDWIEHHEV